MAFPSGWGRKCELVIQSSQVTSDCTDFPVLIHKDNLPSEIFDADGSYPALNGGGDICFSSDSAGSTQLPCEIVEFVTDNNPANGKSYIWVKRTISASSNTSIWIWYNKTGESQPAIDSTYGAENVWNSGFKMIQHMNEDPSGSSPQMIDSTSNDNDGTSAGTMTSADLVDGKVGKAIDFDAGDDYINCGTNSILNFYNTDYTIGAWININSHPDVSSVIYGRAISTGGLVLRVANLGTLGFIHFGTSAPYSVFSNTSLTLDQWLYISVVYDLSAGNVTFYLDGSSDGTPTISAQVDAGSRPAIIGIDARDLNGYAIDGTIDEVRISNVTRSSGWIQTEYNSQNSPNTFIIEGTPESLGGWTGKFMGVTNPAKINGVAVANISKVMGIS